jgi:hypothetical protein
MPKGKRPSLGEYSRPNAGVRRGEREAIAQVEGRSKSKTYATLGLPSPKRKKRVQNPTKFEEKVYEGEVHPAPVPGELAPHQKIKFEQEANIKRLQEQVQHDANVEAMEARDREEAQAKKEEAKAEMEKMSRREAQLRHANQLTEDFARIAIEKVKKKVQECNENGTFYVPPTFDKKGRMSGNECSREKPHNWKYVRRRSPRFPYPTIKGKITLGTQTQIKYWIQRSSNPKRKTIDPDKWHKILRRVRHAIENM